MKLFISSHSILIVPTDRQTDRQQENESWWFVWLRHMLPSLLIVKFIIYLDRQAMKRENSWKKALTRILAVGCGASNRKTFPYPRALHYPPSPSSSSSHSQTGQFKSKSSLEKMARLPSIKTKFFLSFFLTFFPPSPSSSFNPPLPFPSFAVK